MAKSRRADTTETRRVDDVCTCGQERTHEIHDPRTGMSHEFKFDHRAEYEQHPADTSIDPSLPNVEDTDDDVFNVETDVPAEDWQTAQHGELTHEQLQRTKALMAARSLLEDAGPRSPLTASTKTLGKFGTEALISLADYIVGDDVVHVNDVSGEGVIGHMLDGTPIYLTNVSQLQAKMKEA